VLTSQVKLCESFANGILMHFKRISIAGKYEVYSDMVRVIILVGGKTITTNIPLRVITNVCSNIEAMQTARFEIIQELTEALKKVCNDENGQVVKVRKRRKRKV